ncbi:hypothetical protein D3C73_514430 [compost metagenome]
MLFAAEEAAAGTFTWFDPFVLAFTLVIAIAFIRLIMASKKNVFAIGFCFVALATFLFMDFVMISGW